LVEDLRYYHRHLPLTTLLLQVAVEVLVGVEVEVEQVVFVLP
jgi:hypothetical protein